MNKKVFLITGASSGIGAVSAVHLASLGHTVYGAARRMDKLNALSSKGVNPIELDITNGDQIKSVVAEIIKIEGHIDVLVNNAGYGCYGAVEDVPTADARAVFEVNVFGLGALTKEVLPHMRKRKEGRIINVSSIAGIKASPLASWYIASKFALEGWSDSLRMELFSFNIPVIVIQPGIIATEFGDVVSEFFPKYSEGSAYKELIDANNNLFANVGKLAADPIVIAKVIEHAGLSKTPKTRYVAGGMAKQMLFMKKVFNTDMKWNRALLKMLGMKTKKNYNL